MAFSINPVENHREREKGVLVYPVYSRRAQGLSIGINLYPGKKYCPFNCPYCEVFPFTNNAAFSLPQMEEDLRRAVVCAGRNIPIKDICFSGNGEPTLFPGFPEALKLAENIRAETAPSAALVIITNGAGLLQSKVFSLLKETARRPFTNIWLKLDAGTPQWYKEINRSSVSFNELNAKIKEFTSCAPVTIQTMLCAVNGGIPPPGEAQAWEQLVLELAAAQAQEKGGSTEGNPALKGIRKVQIYGKTRPAPEDPKASPLPAEYLEQRAASLRKAFSANNIDIPVEVYL